MAGFEQVWTVGTGQAYATIMAAINGIHAFCLAINGNANDMTGMGVQHVWVYGEDATDNVYAETITLVAFINLSANDYIHIKAMVPHNGIAQADGGHGIKIEGQPGAGWCVVMNDYCKIEGFDIGDYTDNVGKYGIYADAGTDCEIYNNIINNMEETGNANIYGITVGACGLVYNNVIYKLASTSAVATDNIGIKILGANAEVYNNTVGGITATAAALCHGIESTDNTSRAINNIAILTDTADYVFNGGETADNTDYNISEDATADDQGALHAQINVAIADIKFYEDTLADHIDLHIYPDSVAYATGINLTAEGYTFDYIHGTHPVTWSIGAHEPIPVLVTHEGATGLITDDGLDYLAFALTEMADGGAPYANNAEIALGCGDTFAVQTDEELEWELFEWGTHTWLARKDVDLATVEEFITTAHTSFGLGEANVLIDNVTSGVEDEKLEGIYEVGLFQLIYGGDELMILRCRVPEHVKDEAQRIRAKCFIDFQRWQGSME